MQSVLIIDHNLIIRRGLRYILDHEYPGVAVGEAMNRQEALAQVVRRSWELIILDIDLPNCTVENIRHYAPFARVLVMGEHADSAEVGRARRMAASGYVGKDAGRTELLRAIRSVASGKMHFGKLQLPKHGTRALADPTSLSPREYRVMLALGEGKRATDIAAELALSIKTVSTYKRRILNKLQLTSIADLVRYVIAHKLS